MQIPWPVLPRIFSIDYCGRPWDLHLNKPPELSLNTFTLGNQWPMGSKWVLTNHTKVLLHLQAGARSYTEFFFKSYPAETGSASLWFVSPLINASELGFLYYYNRIEAGYNYCFTLFILIRDSKINVNTETLCLGKDVLEIFCNGQQLLKQFKPECIHHDPCVYPFQIC